MRSTPKNLMEKSSVLFGMSKIMAITGLLQSFCQCQMMQYSNHSPMTKKKTKKKKKKNNNKNNRMIKIINLQ